MTHRFQRFCTSSESGRPVDGSSGSQPIGLEPEPEPVMADGKWCSGSGTADGPRHVVRGQQVRSTMAPCRPRGRPSVGPDHFAHVRRQQDAQPTEQATHSGNRRGRYPDRLEYKSALARLLAAAPDDRVRNAKQALAIIDRDFKGQRTTEIGETLAMALADAGDFDQAVGIQQAIMASASSSGLMPVVARMAANLRLYQQHQPCRRPWPNDQPVVLSESAPTSSTF